MLSRSLFLQNFISSIKFLEFSFEYFPQYVYSFSFVNNLVQRKGNILKVISTLVKNKRNLYSPLPNCKGVE